MGMQFLCASLPPPSGSGGGGGAWQLATAHYQPAYISPTIIHPRPDTDTAGQAGGNPQSWERARLAPDGIPWRVPICIYGGAWPFKYQLVSGPAGMSIGQTYGSTDYGVLSWSSPVIGTYTITVQVTTQDYGRTGGSADSVGQYTISWTLVVADHTDVTKFVYLDATNGSDSNNGAYATPWQTLSGFTAASTNGKQLIFRNGTYALNVLSSVLDLTSRAKVWIGYPGATVKVDLSGSWSGTNCYIFFNGGTGSTSGGCSASNIWFYGTPSNWATVNSSGGYDTYQVNHFGDRGLYYENIFDSVNGHGVTPTNFSNWSGIAMFANSAMHNYISCVRNTFQNFSNLYSGGACIWYSARWALWEGNTVQGFSSPTNVQQGFISKGHVSRCSMRNNTMWVQQGTFASPIQGISTGCYFQGQGNDGNQGDNPDQNETCWNVGFNPPAGNNGVTPGAAIYGNGTYASWTGWEYRNTFIGPRWASGAAGFTNTLYSTNNVLLTEHGIENDATHYGATNLTLNVSGDVVDIFTNRASVVDSTTGYLLSSYATAHGITIGTVGHQVQ